MLRAHFKTYSTPQMTQKPHRGTEKVSSEVLCVSVELLWFCGVIWASSQVLMVQLFGEYKMVAVDDFSSAGTTERPGRLSAPHTAHPQQF